MAQAKNMINNLRVKINHLLINEQSQSDNDWRNGEMACLTLAIFGGDSIDYWFKFGLEEFHKKAQKIIYDFQSEIYGKMLSGKLSNKEYEYAYIKSKKLLQ